MLTRKPRIGEKLAYDSGTTRDTFTVKRFENNIMYVTRSDGSETLIIWRFHDGLNKCLSHEPCSHPSSEQYPSDCAECWGAL